MPTFEATVRVGARSEKVQYVAANDDEARKIARQRGVVQVPPRRMREAGGRGINSRERMLLLRQLASGATSRKPVAQTLEALRRSSSKRVATCVSQLLVGVNSGRQIVELIAADRVNFPPPIGDLVLANAKAGSAVEAFKVASDYEFELSKVRAANTKGLYRAAAYIIGSAAVLLALPLYGTPYLQDQPIFKMSKQPISWAWLDYLSYAAAAGLGILALVGVLVFFNSQLLRRLAPDLSDAISLRLPVVRDLQFTREQMVVMTQFARMQAGGLSLDQTLASLVGSLRPGALRNDFLKAHQAVKSGQAWVPALTTFSPLSRASLEGIDDRIMLVRMLDEIADEARFRYRTILERLEPAAAFVGGLALATVYGIFGLYSMVPFSKLTSTLMSAASTGNF